MKQAKFLYNNIERLIAVICLACMVAGLTYNTVNRYLFSKSLPWMEEVCAYMMIWLVYTSVSYAVKQKAHICVDSVVGLYPRKLRPYILLFGQIVWLAFCVAIVIIGYSYTYSLYAKGGRAITLPLPIWVVYAIIPAGHAFVALRLIEEIIGKIRNISGNVETDETPGSAIDRVEILNQESELAEIRKIEKEDEEETGGTN